MSSYSGNFELSRQFQAIKAVSSYFRQSQVTSTLQQFISGKSVYWNLGCFKVQTQFTKEEEKDSILPFLDTLVQRNPDKAISVKVYRKPTHTNQYLNYTSHHSTSAKQSVITALFDRADNVVSSEEDKEEGKQHIRQPYKKWIP